MGDTGADATDLHHLQPADWNVNVARSNLPFDWCNASSACRDVPAHAEAANSTGKDSRTFMPPAIVRCDIARALMYTRLWVVDLFNGSLFKFQTSLLCVGTWPSATTAQTPTGLNETLNPKS